MMTQISAGTPILASEPRTPGVSRKPDGAATEQAAVAEDRFRDFFDEVTSGELFSTVVNLSPDQIQRAAEVARDMGAGLEDVWKNLGESVRKALDLPALEQAVSPEEREQLAELARRVGYGVGFTGAGVLVAAGLYKIVEGLRAEKKTGVADGVVDLTAGAAVAASVVATETTALVMGTVAATLGALRGAHNAWAGYREGDTRHEVQGFLDACNNSVVLSRVLGKQVGAMAELATVLAPLAATVQLARGYNDVSAGLKENMSDKKVLGLADVASAVGLALTACGLPAVPGVALVGVASAVKALYLFNDRARASLDSAVDGSMPVLEKVVSSVDGVVDPAVRQVREWIERATGVERGEDEAHEPLGTASEESALAAA